MVHCTIAMPNQYDQQNINTKHAHMRECARTQARPYTTRAIVSERAHTSVKQHTSH